MTVATQQREAELSSILQTYNAVTERLKQSHEVLRQEVCRLRVEVHEKNLALERSERLAALGEMAAGVAHEIRNPLGGIGLYASLLEGDLVDQPQSLETAKRISGAVRRVESTIADILAFSSGAEPSLERAGLADILDQVLAQVGPRVDSLGASLDVDVRLTKFSLHCDRNQIERALLNLVGNALDASGKGGRVWIRAGQQTKDDSLVAIVVEDDGPGFTDNQLKKVFNPFYTTKDSGTGLGLAIVHRIAESHGGSISAGSRKGGGAMFVLMLPRTQRSSELVEQGGDA